MKVPENVPRNIGVSEFMTNVVLSIKKNSNKLLYLTDERSGIGKTFGNVCRSCSVCFHPDVSYGAYLEKKRKAEKIQEVAQEEKS